MTHRHKKYYQKQEAEKLKNKNGLPSEGMELELINSFSRKLLTEDEVYIFSVTLCDNEVDRDFEAFSTEALKELAGLFVGKTGISDHSMRSADQTARIFYCYTETDDSRKTSYGESYTALKARAYTLRTKGNADFIAMIDGGIKKEVSVGCSMKRCTCSICGEDMNSGECEHIKGKTYNGRLCFGILSEAADAYEWSFVAVPAQRNAGVTKAFKKPQEEKMKNVIEIIKNAQGEVSLSKAQVSFLKARLEEMETDCETAKLYKGQLIEDATRFTAIVMAGVDLAAMKKSFGYMDIPSLKKLRDDLEKKVAEHIPTATQLSAISENRSGDNAGFMI